MPPIQFRKLHPDAQVPRYAHTGPYGDLAADLYSVAAVTLAPLGQPGSVAMVPTGIALVFPPEFGALIQDRSGLAVKGVTTLAGVIDPGYRGEIKVVLTNLNPTPFTIAPGDRIAQMRIVPLLQATFEEFDSSESLDQTMRGEGGFGSTGV